MYKKHRQRNRLRPCEIIPKTALLCCPNRGYGRGMASKHFTNTGQVLQLIVTVIGTVIAGINAYPSIAAIDLFAMWPIVFYLFLIISALALAFQFRQSAPSYPPTTSTAVPPKPEIPSSLQSVPQSEGLSPLLRRFPGVIGVTHLTADISVLSLSLKPGERKLFASDIHGLELVFHKIDKSDDGQVYVDLTVNPFGHIVRGGEKVKVNGDNRFLVPSSGATGNVSRSVVSFTISQKFIDVNLVKVDHINDHSGETDITVARCFGVAT